MKEFSTKPVDCLHFGLCSGCRIKDIYNEQSWNEIFSFFKKVSPTIDPKIFLSPFYESRLKAKLALQKDKEEKIAVGLYRENSHEVLDIPYCLVHHSQINRAVAIIKEAIQKFDFPLFLEGTKEGLLRYIQLFVQRATGKVQLSLVLNANDECAIKKHLPFFDYLFANEDIFHSIWINFNDTSGNVIFSKKWHLLHGEELFWQKIGRVDFLFHPMSFAQSNLEMFEKMIRFLEKEVIGPLNLEKKNFLELYAGNGSIGLNLAKIAQNITLVESNPFSEIFFKKSIEKAKIDNALFLCQEVKDMEKKFENYDLIVADPPRKGLDLALLNNLFSMKSGYFVYVSCFFKSFRRDAEELLQNGWRLKKGDGFLFFPGTDHIEILALFEKKCR